MSGHLLELDTMMPLSTLKLSTGRPAMFQSRIFTGSPRVAASEKVCEHGIFFSLQSFSHNAVASCVQKVHLCSNERSDPNVEEINCPS